MNSRNPDISYTLTVNSHVPVGTSVPATYITEVTFTKYTRVDRAALVAVQTQQLNYREHPETVPEGETVLKNAEYDQLVKALADTDATTSYTMSESDGRFSYSWKSVDGFRDYMVSRSPQALQDVGDALINGFKTSFAVSRRGTREDVLAVRPGLKTDDQTLLDQGLNDTNAATVYTITTTGDEISASW